MIFPIVKWCFIVNCLLLRGYQIILIQSRSKTFAVKLPVNEVDWLALTHCRLLTPPFGADWEKCVHWIIASPGISTNSAANEPPFIGGATLQKNSASKHRTSPRSKVCDWWKALNVEFHLQDYIRVCVFFFS